MKPLVRPLNRAAMRSTGTVAIALAAALGALVTSSAPAMAATGKARVTYKVKVSSSGTSGTGSGRLSLTTRAPATVAPGGAFTITVTDSPLTVPGSVDGVSVTDVKGLSLAIRVPAHSRYVSCALRHGSGLGSGKLSCSQRRGVVTFLVPGPIQGGTKATLPVMILKLKAGGSGIIRSRMAGTSYRNPGLKAIADLSALGIPFSVNVAGYPHPSPALTRTRIR